MVLIIAAAQKRRLLCGLSSSRETSSPGRPIELILAVWSLLAVIVATTQALDITTRKAGLICLIAWPLIQIAVGFIQVLEQEVVQFTN